MKKMTEYTFEIKSAIKVSVPGRDTDKNFELAIKKALKTIYLDQMIEESNLECADASTYELEEPEEVCRA